MLRLSMIGIGLVCLGFGAVGCKDEPKGDAQDEAKAQTAKASADEGSESTSAGPKVVLELAEPTTATSVRWLDQGWTEEQRQRWYHLDQGAESIAFPYEWFIALEQPSPTPDEESPLLRETAFLERLGFLAGKVDPELNPDGLPVGFARIPEFDNPIHNRIAPHPATGKRYAAIGFTCGGCHTGQVEYGGQRLVIDGSTAMIDMSTLTDAIIGALVGLKSRPRALRFIARVLPDATWKQKQQLIEQMKAFGEILKTAGVDDRRALASLGVESHGTEGFGRLDAYNRIATQLFWKQQRQSNGATGPEFDVNYARFDAPVNYPHVWSASWFDSVQYNGSLRQPMFRNFFAVMGGGARMNLGSDPDEQLRSSVNVVNMHQLESELAGEPPFPERRFSGLLPPPWPEDVLGAIDRAKANKGAALYDKHCQRCHLPAPNTPEFWDESRWVADPDAKGGPEGEPRRYLKLDLVPLDVIGTDPEQAVDMATRKIQLPEFLGGEVVDFPEALARLEGAIAKAYEGRGVPPEDYEKMNGYRSNVVRGPMAYRPRPLDGIWATGPYLHNGSVPTLYHLLSPVSERPATFYLGSRQFDPETIGFEYGEGKGFTRVDTTETGNHNTGHAFDDGGGKGTLGPTLTEDERQALLEYLKTL